jgi:hypothetical protein
VTRFLAYCLYALGTSTLFVATAVGLRQGSGASDLPSHPVNAEKVRRLTPSAEALRKRFGIGDSGTATPDLFVLGPFKLSVKYGSDRLVCHISIEPVDIGNPYLPKEKVSELFDELAPPAMRGRGGSGEFRSSACGGMGIADYENVFMERWPNYCAAEHPGTEKRAIIQFKRDLCPNPYIQRKAEPVNSQ